MTKYLFKYTRLVIVIGDGFFMNLLFFIGYEINNLGHKPFSSSLFVFVVNASWIIANLVHKDNIFYRISGKMRIFRAGWTFVLLHFLLIHTFFGILHLGLNTEKLLQNVYIPALVLIPFWRYFVKMLMEEKRREGHSLKKVIIVGASEEGKKLGRVLEKHPEYGYRFEGFFDNTEEIGGHIKGKISEVTDYVLEHNIDEIYCAISSISNEEGDDLLEFAENNFKRIHFIPIIKPDEQLNRFKIEYYDQLPVMVMPSSPLDNVVNRFIKRMFDILVSSLVIIFILSWLLPVISLLIVIDSRGPVLYRQRRSGLNNSVFWCWKFRSMKVDSNNIFRQATKGDSRITRVGAVLRKTNLDELPQFFNVLIGNMSIIGPRPHPIELDSQYVSSVAKYKKRLAVKPGITGLSQVKGYRGETNEEYQMRNRITMDIFYSENWSLLFDFKIILLTIITTINGDSKAY